jgi:hypothetical protein
MLFCIHGAKIQKKIRMVGGIRGVRMVSGISGIRMIRMEHGK